MRRASEALAPVRCGVTSGSAASPTSRRRRDDRCIEVEGLRELLTRAREVVVRLVAPELVPRAARGDKAGRALLAANVVQEQQRRQRFALVVPRLLLR